MNDLEIARLVAIAKDAMTGLAAGVAAVVAVMGLRTWKRQLHGNTNYELARRLLRATYKLREAIRWVRIPFMSVGEMTAAMKASGSAEATGDERGEGLAYDVRFRRVVDARVEFDAELLEAEALWGAEIRQRGDALNAITGELQGSLARWLNRTRRQMDPDREERVCGVIYDDDTNYSAEFSQKVKEAFEAFEKLIRPHLKL